MRFLQLLFFFGACVVRAEDPVDYCPLREGMEWTMDAKITLADGMLIDATARRTIGAKEERNGKTYFRMRTWMEGAPFQMEFETLVRRDETGLYDIDLRDPKLKEGASMLLPFVVGKKWSRTADEDSPTLEVLALEDLTINGKTYEKCFRIRAATKDGNYTEELWQAPGLGSIRSDVVLTQGPGKVRISVTLREFKSGAK